MDIMSIEYVTRVFVEYYDSERMKAKEWLTSNGYELIFEHQLISNVFSGEAEKKIKLTLVNQNKYNSNPLDAAKIFVESKMSNKKFRKIKIESGKEVDTGLPDYPKAIEFRSAETISKTLIYINNMKDKYYVTAWSEGL